MATLGVHMKTSHSANEPSTLSGPVSKAPFVRISSRASEIYAEIAAAKEAAAPSPSFTRGQLFVILDNAQAEAESRIRQRVQAHGL